MLILFDRIDQALGRLYDAIGTLVGIIIGLFAIALSLDLVLRLTEIGNLPGMQEIIEYLLFACVFLAAPWVLRLGSHVRVDLLASGLPPSLATVLDRCLDVVGLATCLILIWFGSVNLSAAYTFGSLQMKYFNVPEWWLLTVFVASFSLLAFEFLSRLLRGGAAPEAASDDAGGM